MTLGSLPLALRAALGDGYCISSPARSEVWSAPVRGHPGAQDEVALAAMAQNPRLLDGAGGILTPLESDADQRSWLSVSRIGLLSQLRTFATSTRSKKSAPRSFANC
jgi:hypothetical protein